MNEIIEEKLKKYDIKNINEEVNALKEITQELILYALAQTDFFTKAYFGGETCLRVVYGLERFSEDLDFSMNAVDPLFNFDNYLDQVLEILNEFGLVMEVGRKKDDNFVKVRELKEDSEKWKLSFPTNVRLKKIMIKLEIDTRPPRFAETENKTLDFPLLHRISVGTKDTLFAGKVHALLCRNYTKGRDWYDFLWYVKNGYKINMKYFQEALNQTGPYKDKNVVVDRKFLLREFTKKIDSNNWGEIIKDVEKFLRPHEVSTLKLWDAELFHDRAQKMIG
jgi:predicted nucleotidyltransferase component of viral defense system